MNYKAYVTPGAQAQVREVEVAAERCHHEPDLEVVDKFLLRIRQENW